MDEIIEIKHTCQNRDFCHPDRILGALGWLESLLMNSPRYNVQSKPVNMDTEAGAGRCGA